MINTRNWKDAIMDGAWSITEVIVGIIKAISIIGGIIGANLADIGFGTLALSFMFGGSMLNIANMTANNWLSLFVSSGTTAIQIALWNLLAKRGIGFKHLINFRKLPSDIQGFIFGASVVWLADTLLDISPLSILIRGSLYEGGGWFATVKVIVYLLVFLLCGFAEPLTANMREMLESGKKVSPTPVPTKSAPYNNPYNSKPKGNSFPYGGGYKQNNTKTNTNTNTNNRPATHSPMSDVKPLPKQGNVNDYLKALQNRNDRDDMEDMLEGLE